MGITRDAARWICRRPSADSLSREDQPFTRRQATSGCLPFLFNENQCALQLADQAFEGPRGQANTLGPSMSATTLRIRASPLRPVDATDRRSGTHATAYRPIGAGTRLDAIALPDLAPQNATGLMITFGGRRRRFVTRDAGIANGWAERRSPRGWRAMARRASRARPRMGDGFPGRTVDCSALGHALSEMP